LLFVFAEEVGDSGGHAGRDGMVTAEDEREKTFAERFFGSGGNVSTPSLTGVAK